MRAASHDRCDELSATEAEEVTRMVGEGFDTIEIRDQIRASRIAGGGRPKAMIYEWQIYNVTARDDRAHASSEVA